MSSGVGCAEGALTNSSLSISRQLWRRRASFACNLRVGAANFVIKPTWEPTEGLYKPKETEGYPGRGSYCRVVVSDRGLPFL